MSNGSLIRSRNMSTTSKLTGLFLGAGASCEGGMPLAWELTAELKKWLTPEKLRSFNDSWRKQGGGHPDAVIDDFIGILVRPDLDYESILGHLETQFMRQSSVSKEYHGLYSWLVQMVYFILYLRHVNGRDMIRRNLKYYDGLSALVDANEPLWIFSLNHDLMIESLAAHRAVPLSSGFTDEVVLLPRRDRNRKITGYLRAEVLPGSNLEQSGMPFFRIGQRGINLLNLHGSLDTFTFRDGDDILKVLPVDRSVDGVLEALRATNLELNYFPDNPVVATNEIAYADTEGEMQFLRRSLLAGAYKYDPRGAQVLPQALLRHFKTNINYLQELIVIGYGFGDDHINHVMRDWLQFDGTRWLVVVGPGVTAIPRRFLHVAQQVELCASTATAYLDNAGGISRSQRETNDRRLQALIRKNVEAARQDVHRFVRDHGGKQMRLLSERIKELPFRDGDLDIESLGVTMEELIEEDRQRMSALFDEDFDRFLKSHGV